ncbi:ABC-2 transporter permease [Cohnella sp. 56]|uniref:ABC-2 transporter permease n=1 Tax=Cohnella sp. 56 TaxID=3113722 RepID=UPI0030EA2474
MYNLLLKDLKLGVNPWFIAMPFLMGALMLVPGWIYLIVLMYFYWISVPSIFAQYRGQNDLLFTSMLPVTRRDMVRARVSVFVILELLHIVVAMIYGLFTVRLYPNMDYYFFAPHLGFWGLGFVMLGIYNLFLFPLFYKTAYKYGPAQIAAIAAATIFAFAAQWAGIQSPYLSDLFNGSGADHTGVQASILAAGIAIFIAFTWIAYRISFRRFRQVEIK